MSRGEPTKRLQEAGWVWLWGLLIAGGAAFAFAWLGSEVLERDAFSWDTSILIALHNIHTPWLDTVMISITNIGLPGGTIITIVVALWLWFRYQRLAALVLVISFSGAWLLYTGLKLLYARPRPSLSHRYSGCSCRWRRLAGGSFCRLSSCFAPTPSPHRLAAHIKSQPATSQLTGR